MQMSVLHTRCAFLIILIILSRSLFFKHIHICILTQHPSTSWRIFNQGQTTTDLFPSIFSLSLTSFLFIYSLYMEKVLYVVFCARGVWLRASKFIIANKCELMGKLLFVGSNNKFIACIIFTIHNFYGFYDNLQG